MGGMYVRRDIYIYILLKYKYMMDNLLAKKKKKKKNFSFPCCCYKGTGTYHSHVRWTGIPNCIYVYMAFFFFTRGPCLPDTFHDLQIYTFFFFTILIIWPLFGLIVTQHAL